MPVTKKSNPKPLPENMEDAILKSKETRKKIKVKIFETPRPAAPPRRGKDRARRRSGY